MGAPDVSSAGRRTSFLRAGPASRDAACGVLVAAAPKSIADRPWLDPDAKPQIVIESINKTFGAFSAVDSVNLRIYKGEMFALVGASGCGKTTLLRMLAGFSSPSGGRIMIEGADMGGAPPDEHPERARLAPAGPCGGAKAARAVRRAAQARGARPRLDPPPQGAAAR